MMARDRQVMTEELKAWLCDRRHAAREAEGLCGGYPCQGGVTDSLGLVPRHTPDSIVFENLHQNILEPLRLQEY